MFTKLSIVILAGVIMAGVSVGAAAENASLTVPLNKSKLIPMKRAVSRVSVGQPKVADIMVTGPKQLYILGKSLGTTNVVLWDENDNSFASFDINVTHDLRTLKAKLHELFPDERPEILSSQENLVVGGQVSSLAKMDAILRVAESFAPGGKKDNDKGSKVLNLMQVGGVQQVMLEVKVAELARNVLKRLGVNLASFRQGSQETNFGLVNGGATFPDAVNQDGLRVPIFGPLDGSTDPVGPAVDEFAPVTPSITGPGLFLSFLDPTFFLQTVIDAAKENGLAQILAEPTLVTLTGQEAQFLSGGEFPIPVSDGDRGVTVEFKEFGIGLKFLPVVLDSGRINLKVNVKVSELTNANSVLVDVPETRSVFVIPALTARSAQSTVELNDGEALSIAGLISDNMRDAVTKFPGLGDVPVLGQLFRSQEFQQNQTELVIFVTARLAQATTPDQIRLPTDGLVVPSDAEYYLLGKNLGKHVKQTQSTDVSQSMFDTETEFGHDVGVHP